MKFSLLIISLLIAQVAFTQLRPLNTTPLPEATAPPTDSIKVEVDDMADEKNGLKSLLLPGWGQVINKQPIKGAAFFAGVAGGTYLTLQKRKKFKEFDNAYISRINNYSNPIDNYQNLTLLELSEKRRQTRSNKDIATAGTAYVYLVNVIDAAAQYKIQREEPGKHSATKAAYYSAILPGLGQAYNKKYWKIPIVYGALGTAGYFALNNRNYHRDYRREIEFRSVGESTGYRTALSETKLKEQLDQWRQYRDIAYVSAGAVYLLNILDATVDAHLYDFNVDEDLSFTPSPVIDQIDGNYYYAIQLTFDFAKKN